VRNIHKMMQDASMSVGSEFVTEHANKGTGERGRGGTGAGTGQGLEGNQRDGKTMESRRKGEKVTEEEAM
jgi:hypothetical protein